MAQVSNYIDDLRSLLGADCVSEREGKLVASPQTTEAVAAVTRYANGNNLAIEIVGGGTKRSWGNPVAADIFLDTTRLTGVREHSWQDLTATVAAGTTWSTMQRALAAHKQQVALDPLWSDVATVGGIIATNDSGALRLKYGSLRDLIIGMTIVLADGTVAKSGGKVVKNVAGYDLHKLMIGAFGTLGVVTEVTFRLHPVSQHAQNFTVSAPQATQLAPLMAALRNSHLLTQALQLRRSMDGSHLDIQLNAHPDAKQDELLEKMTEVAGFRLDPATPEIWTAHENLLKLKEDHFIALKATMSPVDVTRFAEVLSSFGGTSVTQSHGIMTAALYGINDIAFHSLREEFEAKGGSVSLLQQYEGLSSCGKPPASLLLMGEIKHQFDLNRVLNPGRFVGGI